LEDFDNKILIRGLIFLAFNQKNHIQKIHKRLNDVLLLEKASNTKKVSVLNRNQSPMPLNNKINAVTIAPGKPAHKRSISTISTFLIIILDSSLPPKYKK
jgi:hypothetical protein